MDKEELEKLTRALQSINEGGYNSCQRMILMLEKWIDEKIAKALADREEK